MRLRPLLIALVVWTGCCCALTAGEPAPASATPASDTPASSIEAPRAIYFGVMGEVARPGVYAAPANLTLSALIKKAGGITPEANKSVRIFRGGLLAEQAFLGSGELPPLLANDLIVVGTCALSRPKPAGTELVTEKSSRPNMPPATAAVQVAFLNLLDRPVIVKMSADQARLPQIVELLGQPAECATKIRVFAPLGAGPHETDSGEQTKHPLESGTVLVFSKAVIAREALPPLPEPIVEVAPLPSPKPIVRAENVVPSGLTPGPVLEPPKESSHAVANNATSLSVAAKEASRSSREPTASPSTVGPVTTAQLPTNIDAHEPVVVDGDHAKPEIAPHVESEPMLCPLFQQNGMSRAGSAPLLRATRDSRAARMMMLMTAMSALAGIAMLLTFASIAQRWMSANRAKWKRRIAGASSDGSCGDQSTGVPAPPGPIDLSGVGRPIRIDAGRPMTRLSVDLAAIERNPSSASAA
jgi:hypothetical protein